MKAKLFLLAALLAATTVNADTAKQVVDRYFNEIWQDFTKCKNYKVNELYAQFYDANPSLEKDLTHFCTELLGSYKECKPTDGPWKKPNAKAIISFYGDKLRRTLELFVQNGSAIGTPCVFK